MKLNYAAWIAAISAAIAGCSWNKPPESATQKAAQDVINATCAKLDSVPEIRDILKTLPPTITVIRHTWLEVWVANLNSGLHSGWDAIPVPARVVGKVSLIMEPSTLCTHRGASDSGRWEWSYNANIPKDPSARLARDMNAVSR